MADYTVRNRESDIKMMELAGVDVISYYSKGGVPLSDKASFALGSNSIAIHRAVAAEAAEVIKDMAKKLGAPGTKLVPFDGGLRIVPAPE